MIRICDALMGSGKTQSCIEMMNSHPDRKYIFITPYLEEATRIKDSCPDLGFVEPSNRIKQFGFTKVNHTNALIKSGHNITTTHQAFLFYTDETLDLINEHGYTLVIDESVNVLESTEVNSDDVDLLVQGGYLENRDGIYSWTGKEYQGSLAKDLMRVAKSRDLVCVEKNGGMKFEMFYWVLPKKLLASFENVYILTYLFTGQPLYYFMNIYNIPYEYIGVEKYQGGYRFCDYPGYTPEYTKSLQSRIHIIEDDKINEIGEPRTALSMNWFDSNPEGVLQLKRNIANFFKHKAGFIPAEYRLWGSHKKGQALLKGKGYTKSFLTFNARAVNEYRDKTCLVYAINIFMNVGEKMFYKAAGIEADEDAYALSTMIQWIWRSAIRDGHEIYLYIPSRRMRELFIAWMDSIASGGELDEE